MAKTSKKSKNKLGRSSSKYNVKKKMRKGINSSKKRMDSTHITDPSSEPAPNINDASTSIPQAPLNNKASLEVTQEGMKSSNATPHVAGFIFMCNGRTKPECYRYRVFGLPSMKLDDVKKISSGGKLFLFDFDLKLLHGVYEATSNGELNLEPMAFKGKFPSQVRFKIFKDCLPVPECVFKRVIKENYEGSKFRQELNKKQVKSLIDLFRPITVDTAPSTIFHSEATRIAQPTHILEKGLVPVPRIPPPVISYIPERLLADAQPVARQVLLDGVPPRVYERYQHENVFGHHPVNHYVRHPAAETQYYSSHVSLPPRGSSHFSDQVHQPYVSEEPYISSHEIYERHKYASIAGEQSGRYANEYHKQDLPVARDIYSSNTSHQSQLVSSSSVTKVPSRVQTWAPHYSVQAAVSSEAYYSYYDPNYSAVPYGNSNSAMAHGLPTSESTLVYEGRTSTLPYGVSDPEYAALQERRAVENVYVADPNLPVSYRYSFPGISTHYQ